jgi:hypothetical protein
LGGYFCLKLLIWEVIHSCGFELDAVSKPSNEDEDEDGPKHFDSSFKQDIKLQKLQTTPPTVGNGECQFFTIFVYIE